MFDILTILRQILQVLNDLKVSNQDRLWKIDDIATYFSMSRATIEQKIIACDGFPRPISINNTHPRWKPEEVKKWAEKNRA